MWISKIWISCILGVFFESTQRQISEIFSIGLGVFPVKPIISICLFFAVEIAFIMFFEVPEVENAISISPLSPIPSICLEKILSKE